MSAAEHDRGRPGGGGPTVSRVPATTLADGADTVPLNEADSRRLTERIKTLLGSVTAQIDKLTAMVTTARSTNVHAALGYRSWSEYVVAEFGDAPLRLDREHRKQLVAALSGEGMSTRAIAPVVGASEGTVRNDLEAGAQDYAPDATVTGIDGKKYKRKSQGASIGHVTLGMGKLSFNFPEEPVGEPTGNDHPAPVKQRADKKSRQRPLPESYFERVWDLRKVVVSLSRLHQDPRFDRNRDGVLRNAHELAVATNQLSDLLDDLGIDRSKHNRAFS